MISYNPLRFYRPIALAAAGGLLLWLVAPQKDPEPEAEPTLVREVYEGIHPRLGETRLTIDTKGKETTVHLYSEKLVKPDDAVHTRSISDSDGDGVFNCAKVPTSREKLDPEGVREVCKGREASDRRGEIISL